MSGQLFKNIFIALCIGLFCSGCAVVEQELCSFTISPPEEAITQKELSGFLAQNGFRTPVAVRIETGNFVGLRYEVSSQKTGSYWEKGNGKTFCRLQINDRTPNIITIRGYPALNPEYKVICAAFEAYLRNLNKKIQIKRSQKRYKEFFVDLRAQWGAPPHDFPDNHAENSAQQ